MLFTPKKFYITQYSLAICFFCPICIVMKSKYLTDLVHKFQFWIWLKFFLVFHFLGIYIFHLYENIIKKLKMKADFSVFSIVNCQYMENKSMLSLRDLYEIRAINGKFPIYQQDKPTAGGLLIGTGVVGSLHERTPAAATSCTCIGEKSFLSSLRTGCGSTPVPLAVYKRSELLTT